MAGDAASAAVDALLALDAEKVALAAANDALARCEWDESVTLAVVVATPGMWTDRVATEVRHRTVANRRAAHGEILLWATDPHRADDIEKESVAEAVRVMWTALHGSARSLHAVLAREGLAYAVSAGAASPEVADPRIVDALSILGDTTTVGDIIAILYGDAAAVVLGYTPLGLADHAGYEFAIGRARALVARVGLPRALRSEWRIT
jgi:hypothetical protein